MMGLPASTSPQTASSTSVRNTQVASQASVAHGPAGSAEKAGVSHESDFAESLAESAQQASTNQSKAQLESSAPASTGVNELPESAGLGSLSEESPDAELSSEPNTGSNTEPNVDLDAGVSVEPPVLVTDSEPDVLTGIDALAEPATQLWHWHYSRGAGSENIGSTAFGEMAAMADAMASKTSAKTNGEAGQMPTVNAQTTASQTASHPGVAAPGQVVSAADATGQAEGALLQVARAVTTSARSDAAAERRVSFSSTFTESGQAPITQLAANKVLLQQLASGSTSAVTATVNVEESSHSLTTSGAQLTSTPGRASVPVHEWAPVVVDSTNKAQLGAQLLHTLKEKVELQLNQEVQQARIKLDPPEMGRLELSIRLEGDKLHIHIAASQGAVRDALNAHADRLRNDLLPHHSGGVEVSVGQEGQPQKSPSSHLENAILMAEQGSAELEQKQQAGAGWINALV